MGDLKILDQEFLKTDKKIIDYYKSIAPPETAIEKAMMIESRVPYINRDIAVLSELGLLDADISIVFYCYMDGTVRLGGHCEKKDKKGYSFYTNRYGNWTDEHGPIVARWIVKPKP